MGNRIENGFLEVVAELDHFFVMTTWTEPAAATAKGQKIFMMAIGAFNSSEALVKISAFKILSHYMLVSMSSGCKVVSCVLNESTKGNH